MSVNTENGSAQGQTTVLEKESVYASLFDKINLTPATSLGDINAFLDDAALSDAPAGERLTAAMQVFMDCIRKSGQPVEKLDKTLIDHHIAELDFQISRQLDAVMHHAEFQKVESLWRGLKQLVDNTDYSLSSGICRYEIATILLQNGERSVSIVPEQLFRTGETGCVRMRLKAPAFREVFYLSMAPEAGWFIRREFQNIKERTLLTEERFFVAVDRLA
ncbi:hypothetical protein EKN38_14005 [Enterobacter sp. WCHEn045836]|nr:hypothetical protein EKN38_14005 [Enterobacter sp. WCHEn045836]